MVNIYKAQKTIRGRLVRGKTTIHNRTTDMIVRNTGIVHSGKIRINGNETYDLAFIFREISLKFLNEKECNEVDCAFVNMARQLREVTKDNILDLIYKIKELKETQLGYDICDASGNIIKHVEGKYEKYECENFIKGPGTKKRARFEERLRELSVLLRTYLTKDNILDTIYQIKDMDDEYSSGSKAKLGDLPNKTCCNTKLPETFKTHLCDASGNFTCPGDEDEEEEDDCGCS